MIPYKKENLYSDQKKYWFVLNNFDETKETDLMQIIWLSILT